MRDIATTTLSGNLTRDVELRQLPSGADVARLRVATSTRRRTGEEWVDKTNYFTIEAFGAQARNCAQYLTKRPIPHQRLPRVRRRRTGLARMERPCPNSDEPPIRCATRCSQWPDWPHDRREWEARS